MEQSGGVGSWDCLFLAQELEKAVAFMKSCENQKGRQKSFGVAPRSHPLYS